jgi:hypothetical protein
VDSTSSPWADFPQTPPSNTTPSGGNPWDDFKPSDPGMFNTVSDNAVQGATFGLGNRAEAGLAALALTAMNDKGLSQNYRDARNVEQGNLKTEMQDSPVTSVLSNLAGGLATGGLASGTKAGAVVADSLSNGGLAARALKGAGLGSLTGAVYGAGTADDGQALQGAQSGAVSGALIGGAFPVAGAALSDVANTALNAGKGILARSPQAVQNAAQSMLGAGGDLYNKMRQVGATFNPQAASRLISDIKSSLASQDFLPSLNPKTLGIINDLDNIVAQAGTNGNLQLSTLDQIRRQLGRIGPTEDGVSAGKIKNVIDDFVNNAGQADLSNGSTDAIDLLNQGRKQYQQASKFQDVADVLTNADGDANKIKSGLTRFMNNDANTRGWSPEELSALKDAASGTITEKLLKMGGKFGFDLGHSTTMGNTVAPLIGGEIGGIGVPIAGTAARIVQTLSAKGKAETLLKTLEGRPTSLLPQLPNAAPALSGAAVAASRQFQGAPNTSQIAPQTVMQPAQPMDYSFQTSQPAFPDVSSFVKPESGGNPNAKNPNSSASGLYQFTNKTWAYMVSKYGQQTGIKLSDKNDPQSQAVMARMYANDNVKALNQSLGRQPNIGELYIAHVLGANGAAKLINANPNRQAVTMFPTKVVDANRSIFFNGKTPRTSGEVYKLLSQKVS